MAKRYTMTTFILCLLGSANALAEATTETRGPWFWGFDAGYVQQIDTELDESGTDFNLTTTFFDASLSYAWDRNTSVSLSIGEVRSDYDFDAGTTIEGLTPWGDVREQRISVPIRFAATDTANVIIIPSIRSNFEKDASFSDGQTEGLIAGAGWKLSDTLTLGPGFGWFSELDGGSTAFPIIVVDWKITDKLSLETGRGLAASRGPGLTLNYALNDKWTLATSARFERIQFALDNDRGIGEHRSSLIVANASYSPWPMTSISIFAGVELGGRLELQDNNGRKIAASDFDTAGIVGVTFVSRF